MPLKLKAPRKGKSPNWTVRGAYLGVRVNRSAGTGDRSVASKILKKIERDIERGALSEGSPTTFASAASSYMRTGGEPRYMTPLIKHFGTTPIAAINQTAIDAAAAILYPTVSAATRNRHVYTPMSAVLRHSGVKLDLRRPKGGQGKRSTSWLWPEQTEAIFAEAEKIDSEFAALLILLCYTGLRLSEALGLTWNDMRLQDGYAYVGDTKNGEPRAVFLPPISVASLAGLNSVNAGDRVFRFAKSGHLYSLLRMATIKAGVDLPERSAFHIFRHTYATWMRRYAGADSQALISTGAWRDRKSVDRYTHTVVSEEAKLALLLPTPQTKQTRK